MKRFIAWLRGGERVDMAWRRWRRGARMRWRGRFRWRKLLAGHSLGLMIVLALLLYYVPPRHWGTDNWWPWNGSSPQGQLEAGYRREAPTTGGGRFSCPNPYVVDGDTIHCGERRIRLAGIDAPELPGHCRDGRNCAPGDPIAARDYLSRMARGAVTCRAIETDVYGRTVARCDADGRDLSCAMLAAGHAIRRYAPLSCG